MAELETEIFVAITSELSYKKSSVAGELKSDESRSQVPQRRINKLNSFFNTAHLQLPVTLTYRKRNLCISLNS